VTGGILLKSVGFAFSVSLLDQTCERISALPQGWPTTPHTRDTQFVRTRPRAARVHTFIDKHKESLDYSVLPCELQFQNIFSTNKLVIAASVV
jgi:hypothetical protein